MKTRLNLWKAGFLTLLVITAFLVGGCDKSPTSTANKSGNQPPAPIQAEAFHGQVYKSFDQRKVLTLISKDECELNEHGTILLCKYTKQNDNLRVVTTALGTSQVLYYRFTNQGLQDNDGNVLFSPEGLLEAQRQVELARRAQQEAQAAAERQEAERQRLAAIAAQREAEELRLADERARKEAPEKLRALLTIHPEISGIMTGYGGATLRVKSFDSGTGSVSAELDFIGHGRTGTTYDPPLAKSRDGHSSRAEGNVSGDTLNLTATWTEKDFFDKVDKGSVRVKLRYDGLARKLVGPAYWGNKESEWLVMSFDLK